MAIICASSMLPCGRYYYEPEGGYVGNPWVKFSFQYIYLYMAWILHHLDLIDHFIFQFFQNFYQKCLKLYKRATMRVKRRFRDFDNFLIFDKFGYKLIYDNLYYDIKIKK
jgi:hypothetical protein